MSRDEFVDHPGGISSLFFAFADLVIHSIFNTDPRDQTNNLTSSYLDLGILYGNSQKEQDSVRNKDGRGRLYEDVFADNRLLFMPPSACALLVLLSRNHNVCLRPFPFAIHAEITFFSTPLKRFWKSTSRARTTSSRMTQKNSLRTTRSSTARGS
jgi:hypothetical protein